MSVMRDALLRRSEAAALTWADVAFRSDGSARVTVRRSKSDQDGTGATLYVGPGGSSGDPSSGRLPESPALRPPFRSGSVESNRRSRKSCGVDGPFLGTLTPDRDGP